MDRWMDVRMDGWMELFKFRGELMECCEESY